MFYNTLRYFYLSVYSHHCIQGSNPACYSQFSYGRLLLFCIIYRFRFVLFSCRGLQVYFHHGWFSLWQNPTAEESRALRSLTKCYAATKQKVEPCYDTE